MSVQGKAQPDPGKGSSSPEEQILAIKRLSSLLLEPEAHERLMFIMQTHADGVQRAQQVLQVAQRRVAQTGRKMSEAELVSVLKLLNRSSRKEGSITIHRK